MKKVITCLLALLMLASFTLPAYAAEEDFVPSIEMKPGPGIVPQPDDNGVPSYGFIIMPDGSKITLPEGAVVITPIADAEDAAQHIEEALTESYDELKNSQSLEELVSNLNDILQDAFDGMESEDLVITDLFHVDITGDFYDHIENGGKLVLTLDASAEILLALEDINGVWTALFGESFVDNGDGTFTLTVKDIGVFAFGKDAGSVDVDPDNPGQSSPTTGDMTFGFVIGAVVFAAAAVVLFAVAKKQTA